MGTIRTFGKEYSYILECEQNKSVEKLLELLKDKAPNPEAVTEEQILSSLKEILIETKGEKAKQTIEALLVKAKELIKSEKKKEAEQTIWYYKLPTLDAQFEETEEIVFQGDLTNEKSKDVTTKFKPANEVKKQAKIIKACLTRVENLQNDDEQSVEWPKDNRTGNRDDFIAGLPPTWRAELARVFRNAATISEEEVKN